MTQQTGNATKPAESLSPWQWCFRLMRAAAMIILAFWLSQTGEAFFYQGF